MKRTIPAGSIAILIWMVAALTIGTAMSVCSSCGATANAAAKASCAPAR